MQWRFINILKALHYGVTVASGYRALLASLIYPCKGYIVSIYFFLY